MASTLEYRLRVRNGADGDAQSNVYVCTKQMGSEPELGPPDPVTLRRTLKLTLRNTEEEDLLCVWP